MHGAEGLAVGEESISELKIRSDYEKKQVINSTLLACRFEAPENLLSVVGSVHGD